MWNEQNKKFWNSTARIVVGFGPRRSCKTRLTQELVKRFCLSGPPKDVLLIIPNRMMLNEIVRTIGEMPYSYRSREIFTRFKFPNGHSLRLITAEECSTLKGYGFDHIIIDEADYLDYESFMSTIRPVVADRQGTIHVLGTRHNKKGTLSQLIKTWQYHNEGAIELFSLGSHMPEDLIKEFSKRMSLERTCLELLGDKTEEELKDILVNQYLLLRRGKEGGVDYGPDKTTNG